MSNKKNKKKTNTHDRSRFKRVLEPFFDGAYAANLERDDVDSVTFDADGFDSHGFNRWGFDRDGYDSDGLDAQGYNRDGWLLNMNLVRPLMKDIENTLTLLGSVTSDPSGQFSYDLAASEIGTEILLASGWWANFYSPIHGDTMHIYGPDGYSYAGFNNDGIFKSTGTEQSTNGFDLFGINRSTSQTIFGFQTRTFNHVLTGTPYNEDGFTLRELAYELMPWPTAIYETIDGSVVLTETGQPI